jgi:hypothetical protein
LNLHNFLPAPQQIACVLVRCDHVASFIVNADHGGMSPAAMLRVPDCVIRFGVPEPTEWQRIGNQIEAAMIFAGPDFVNVHEIYSSSDWLGIRV